MPRKPRALSKRFRKWLEKAAADENFEALLSCGDARAILAALEYAERPALSGDDEQRMRAAYERLFSATTTEEHRAAYSDCAAALRQLVFSQVALINRAFRAEQVLKGKKP